MPIADNDSGLHFGVSSTSYGSEGGLNGPGEPANNWVLWEHSGHVEPSGLACDGWADPSSWIERAQALGVDSVTLGVEWARTEPADGAVDAAAIDRYASTLAELRRAGIEPTVELSHFTHPWWLGQEFWLMPGSPERFARHVAEMTRALGEHCSNWITIAEPAAVSINGWVTGRFPPGRRLAVADRYAVLDNLLCAHVLAARAIGELQPSAAVGMSTGCSRVYDFDRICLDLLAAPSLEVATADLDEWIALRRREFAAALARPSRSGAPRRVSPLYLASALSPYGPTGGRAQRRLRRPSPRRLQRVLAESGAAPPFNFVAVEHPGALAAGDPAAALGVAAWCGDLADTFPTVAIRVSGAAVAGRVHNGAAVGEPLPSRREAIAADLEGLGRARRAGVPIESYSYRSLVDEYGFGSYELRTGLYGMDRARGTRGIRWLETDSAGDDAVGAYAKLIESARAQGGAG